MTANPRSIFEPIPMPKTGNRETMPSRSGQAVILPVPVDKSGKSGLDRRSRLEAEVAAVRFYISIAGRHIAGLHRQQLLCCRPAKQPFEHTDKVEQLLGTVIAKI